MDPAPARALARLRDPEDEALVQLARTIARQTAETPIREVAEPRWIAGQLAAALEALTHGEHARDWFRRQIASERARWSVEDRPAGAFVPSEADRAIRELLAREMRLGEELTFRILDQAAIRALLREVLANSLKSVRERLRSDASGIGDRVRAENVGLGEMGRRAARRGKGLLGAVNIGAVADNVRGLTEGLVGAVREEFEQTLDARLGDHLRNATTEAVRTMARYLADPGNTEQLAQTRLAVLDVLLDTPIRELVAQTEGLQAEDALDLLLAALRSAVEAEGFVDRAEVRVGQLLAEAGEGTLGDWLEEVGLAEVWLESTAELLTARLRAVVRTDAFGAWWASLFAD